MAAFACIDWFYRPIAGMHVIYRESIREVYRLSPAVDRICKFRQESMPIKINGMKSVTEKLVLASKMAPSASIGCPARTNYVQVIRYGQDLSSFVTVENFCDCEVL